MERGLVEAVAGKEQGEGHSEKLGYGSEIVLFYQGSVSLLFLHLIW